MNLRDMVDCIHTEIYAGGPGSGPRPHAGAHAVLQESGHINHEFKREFPKRENPGKITSRYRHSSFNNKGYIDVDPESGEWKHHNYLHEVVNQGKTPEELRTHLANKGFIR